MATIHNLRDEPRLPPNSPRMEWLFDAVEAYPPARQKRLIVQAAMLGIIERDDATIMIDALGLGSE
jgi:hypothetical protein